MSVTNHDGAHWRYQGQDGTTKLCEREKVGAVRRMGEGKALEDKRRNLSARHGEKHRKGQRQKEEDGLETRVTAERKSKRQGGSRVKSEEHDSSRLAHGTRLIGGPEGGR